MLARAAAGVAATGAAGRVVDRALARPRSLASTARTAGRESLALLRTEAELARIEVSDQLPRLVRSGATVVFGLVLVGITPALLVTAGVLWLGPDLGYAGASLLFAGVAGLTGVVIARAGMAMLRQVSLVPRDSLGRIEAGLARIGEALAPPPEPAAGPSDGGEEPGPGVQGSGQSHGG